MAALQKLYYSFMCRNIAFESILMLFLISKSIKLCYCEQKLKALFPNGLIFKKCETEKNTKNV
jgi:hypothetical protein